MTTTSLVRSRWAAIGAAVAVSLGAGGIGIGYAKVGSGERAVYDPINPCRLADFRPASQVGPKSTPLGPDGVHTLDGWGATGDCNLPSGTAGLALNVTALDATAPTFLRFWPADGAQPTTANLNPTPGQPPTPNAVNVGLSSAGKFKVFNRFGNVNVVIDVVGVYVDHDHDDRYYTESEVDVLVASIPEGPQGPPGPPGAAAADYENVIIVAQSGGDFTSVSAAVDAIGVDPDYPAASSTERYLVWVAPGLYDGEHVVMKPYVDIEGSGQGVTLIRSIGGDTWIGASSATVVGADNAELRHLTVEIEPAVATHMTHAIFTEGSTTLRNVTANAVGGNYARGLMIHTGASPLLIDVIARASGGSQSNLGVDVYQATVFVDGLFVEAWGGSEATGIFVNTASSEVQMENVTTRVSDGTSQTHGLKTNLSDVTLEGYRATVTSAAGNSRGLWCDDQGRALKVLDATVFVSTSAASGAAYGVIATSCDLEVRNAVIDVVTAGGQARGVQHHQVTGATLSADVTVADAEVRAFSGSWTAYGILLTAATGAAETYGRVSEANVRATGGSTGSNTWGIRHDAPGEIQYRGMSIIVEGSANFMYGIQTVRGTPRFDDVVIDAVGTASTTVFGVEFFSDSTTLSNARIKAVNTGSGSGHDAVGIKSNDALDATFLDVTAYAEAETNVWGADFVGSTTRAVGIDVRAVGNPGGTTRGGRCLGGSVEIDDSTLRAGPSASAGFGLDVEDCELTLTGSRVLVDPGSGNEYALLVDVTSGSPTQTVRDSYLAAEFRTVSTAGLANLQIVASQLDGGAADSVGVTDVQECTAITYNSGGAEVFQATTSDPCP